MRFKGCARNWAVGLAMLSAFGAEVGWSFSSTTFLPVADTALLEVAPSNNLGGFPGMNAGTTQEFKRTRALFRYDLTSLPTNTVVLSATVHTVVTREPGFGEPSNNGTFGLHRLLRPWGEGDKNPFGSGGKGLPATAGEATWNFAFYPTNAWTTPGGLIGVDFSATESSFQQINGLDNYPFDATPDLIEDVTAWLQQPESNFGWMLRCTDESIQSTARRFGSREDGGNEPVLELQFLVPPLLQIFKTNALPTQLHFTAWADHTYDVQYRNSLTTGTWLLLTNLTAAPTNYAALITDSASVTQRFYRISAY